MQIHPENLAKLILQHHGAALELAEAVQDVINGMSYSGEIADPERTRSLQAKKYGKLEVKSSEMDGSSCACMTRCTDNPTHSLIL